MSRKIIFYSTIIILVAINIVLDMNVNNYIKILNECFNQSITLNSFYYTVICFIFVFISILIIVAMKLVVFYKEDEIKGINLKTEDGTFGTANWLKDDEINSILGGNNTKGLILGKKNNDIIKLPFNSHFNKNITVFGSSGSMKTIRIFSNKFIRITKV